MITDDELASFEDGLEGIESRVTKFFIEGTDRTPEQLDAAIDDYEMPDPLLEDRSVGD